MLIVAPVFSRITPIMIPRIIMIPMDFMVSPNPCVITGMISFAGRIRIARSIDTRSIERKVLCLNVEVRRTIRIMLTRTAESIKVKLIFSV
jgi:hypothetical protein